MGIDMQQRRIARPGDVHRRVCRVGDGTRPIALAELTDDAARYDRATVATEGLVQTYDEPRHYWIEDHDRNRVEL